METMHAIYLGIIQGITEFLPISSSAHLILASKLLHWPDQGLIFDIAVHFGSLIAVMIYFKKQVYQIIKGMIDFVLRKQSNDAELFKKIVIATIPVVIFGLLLKDIIENNIRDSIIIIGITSIVWGILLYFADKKEELITDNSQISYKTALLMGFAQALAIIPGTSRSGSTMTVARFLKFSRTVSAEFSMIMSIPVIFLMTIYSGGEIILENKTLPVDYTFLIVGTITSFIFAIATIHLLMKLVDKIGFMPFVVYRLILGLFIFYIVF